MRNHHIYNPPYIYISKIYKIRTVIYIYIFPPQAANFEGYIRFFEEKMTGKHDFRAFQKGGIKGERPKRAAGEFFSPAAQKHPKIYELSSGTIIYIYLDDL